MQAVAADGVRVLIGSVDGRQGEPSAEKVNEPFAIDFDAKGMLYGVEFTRGNRVFRSTKPIGEWTGEGELPVDFHAGTFRVTIPGRDEAFSPVDPANPSLRKALFSGMHDLAVSPDGRIFLADTFHHCLRRYDPGTAQIDLVAGVPPKAGAAVGEGWRQTELRRPHGARIAPDGRLLIADSDNDRVLIGHYDAE